jgi:hypothetical protein
MLLLLWLETVRGGDCKTRALFPPMLHFWITGLRLLHKDSLQTLIADTVILSYRLSYGSIHSRKSKIYFYDCPNSPRSLF